MSAIDQVLTGFGWKDGDLNQARSELAALRARVAELEQAVNEARELIENVTLLDKSGYWMNRRAAWLAAHPAPEPQP